METTNYPAIRVLRPAWNKDRIVGQKRPVNRNRPGYTGALVRFGLLHDGGGKQRGVLPMTELVNLPVSTAALEHELGTRGQNALGPFRHAQRCNARSPRIRSVHLGVHHRGTRCR